MTELAEPADSAGTPWRGRDLPAGPFAGDDGAAHSALARALARLADHTGEETEVVAALATARVFVPIVALADEAAQMALLTVSQADGRQALPVFSSPVALSAWRPEARPVPVLGPRAALSAVAEGCDLLELDPAGPVPYVVRRPAVWALGQGRAWTPSYADGAVADAVAAACEQEGVRSRCEPGTGAELRIVLGVPAGLAGEDLQAVIARVSRRLAADGHVAQAVDSVEITVLPVTG